MASIEATRKRTIDKFKAGTHPLQNLTQEQNDNRSINRRLALMKNGLDQWDENFNKKFKAFGKRMPTKKECMWVLNQQRKSTQGIQDKVEFKRKHGKGSTEWKDRLAELKTELDKKGKSL